MARSRKGNQIDWVTASLYFSLLLTGWIILYAATANELSNGFDWSSTIGRQSIWLIISITVFFAILLIDIKFWQTFAYPFYAFSIIMLIIVFIFGHEVKGARSWINLMGLSFQPSELAKFTTILALSSYLSYFKTEMHHWKSQLTAFGIILLPSFLILLQPDAGSALVFSSLLIVLYRAGLPSIYYIILFTIVVGFILGLLIPLQYIFLILSLFAIIFALYSVKTKWIYWILPIILIGLLILQYYNIIDSVWIWSISIIGLLWSFYLVWRERLFRFLIALPSIIIITVLVSFLAKFTFDNVLEPHQQDRINVWLQPDKCDPQGALYNVLQSQIAIGSGGFQGKGFLEGNMTKLKHVPEQSTDFIFSTIGEEQGFIGAFAVVLIFTLLVLRIIQLGEWSPKPFTRYYAYGLAALIFFHYFINIGMTMGLVPIIGIPLPFISKGGTAILMFSIMIAVFLKMSPQGKVR